MNKFNENKFNENKFNENQMMSFGSHSARPDVNLVWEFVNKFMLPLPGNNIPSRKLYDAYNNFYNRKLSDVKLAKLFEQMNLKSTRVSSGKVWLDYALRYDIRHDSTVSDFKPEFTKREILVDTHVEYPLHLLGRCIRNISSDIPIRIKVCTSGSIGREIACFRVNNKYVLMPELIMLLPDYTHNVVTFKIISERDNICLSYEHSDTTETFCNYESTDKSGNYKWTLYDIYVNIIYTMDNLDFFIENYKADFDFKVKDDHIYTVDYSYLSDQITPLLALLLHNKTTVQIVKNVPIRTLEHNTCYYIEKHETSSTSHAVLYQSCVEINLTMASDFICDVQCSSFGLFNKKCYGGDDTRNNHGNRSVTLRYKADKTHMKPKENIFKHCDFYITCVTGIPSEFRHGPPASYLSLEDLISKTCKGKKHATLCMDVYDSICNFLSDRSTDIHKSGLNNENVDFMLLANDLELSQPSKKVEFLYKTDWYTNTGSSLILNRHGDYLIGFSSVNRVEFTLYICGKLYDSYKLEAGTNLIGILGSKPLPLLPFEFNTINIVFQEGTEFDIKVLYGIIPNKTRQILANGTYMINTDRDKPAPYVSIPCRGVFLKLGSE